MTEIFCCACQKPVEPRLTNGAEIYPHRADLADLPFWKCDACNNYVGCHHKTGKPTKPLGNIPTKELRGARNHIHGILDPLWKEQGWKRGKIYALLAEEIGREYHTAEIRSVEEARQVYAFLLTLSRRAA